MRKPKKPSVSKLKKKLDIIYSTYRRLSEADENGYVTCVTCGVKRHYKDRMQNGHYIDRHISSTRYLDKNCHVQCVGCNMFGGGKKDIYALYLIKRYGEGILEHLNDLKKQTKQFKVYELEEMMTSYKQKLISLSNHK